MIIGIAGKKRSGKDTFAKFLIEELKNLGYFSQRRAFADSLKDEAANMLVDYGRFDKIKILQMMNEDQTKEKFRLLLQWWGTEFRRELCENHNYWVESLLRWIDITQSEAERFIIVPDVRFVNEFNAIKKEFGYIIKITRPMLYIAEDVHKSETALDDFEDTTFDFVVDNNSSLEQLQYHAQIIAQSIVKEFKSNG